ncbi:MAG: ATP-binding protein [Gammaproteobacteria bacterium]
MSIDWQTTHAAVWRQQRAYLRAVQALDTVRLHALVNIDEQKRELCRNTERFLNGLPANNALLWGARGTGKSSLVKALLNEYHDRGLRLIQVDKEDLHNLPEIVDDIRELPQRFIVFCDDLSFESGESGYKALKSVLEGGIEVPPQNVLIYATSNRRHLLPEYMRDNLDTKPVDGELHYADAIEEKISLSDRFGLWLSFYPSSQDGYLRIVDSYFPNYPDREHLHLAAKRFALARGSRSGRTAKQFYLYFSGED